MGEILAARDGTPGGGVLVIGGVGVRRKDLRFKSDDRLNLLARGCCTLCMTGRGINCLMRKVFGDRHEGAVGVLECFAAIPHHRAEEKEICCRQWAPIGRDRRGARAAVGIVIVQYCKLGVRGDLLLNANQALIEEQAVSLPAGGLRRHVLRRAAGAVVWPKDGIGAVRGLETRLNMSWNYGPGVACLMACYTAAPIGS